MNFADFHRARVEAEATLEKLRGDRDFPGLSIHDRTYALPVDWQGERYTAIVRAHAQHANPDRRVPIEIWHWHWRDGGQSCELTDLDPRQLAAVADIMETVRYWIDGEMQELPPNTANDWRVPDSES